MPNIENQPPDRGSSNPRINGQTRQLIDDAAAVLGKTRTEFIEYPADSRTLFLPIETVIAANFA